MPDPAFNAKLEQMADEMLAVRACSGDSGAMALLTARMVPLVKTLAAKYGGGAMEPEDLAQEGMLGFLAAVHGYDEKSGVPFRSYAGVCIANRIRSAVRAGARLKNIPLNSYISLNDDSIALPQTQPNPEDLVIARDEAVRFDAIMASSCLIMSAASFSYISAAAAMRISQRGWDLPLSRWTTHCRG